MRKGLWKQYVGLQTIILALVSIFVCGALTIYASSQSYRGFMRSQILSTHVSLAQESAIDHLWNRGDGIQWTDANAKKNLQEFTMHLTSLGDVLGVNVYDLNGFEVYSNSGSLNPGMKTDSDFKDALTGQAQIADSKVGWVFSLSQSYPVHIYVPLLAPDKHVFGVVELNLDEIALVREIRTLATVFFALFFSLGSFVFFLLLAVFRRERQELEGQVKERTIELEELLEKQRLFSFIIETMHEPIAVMKLGKKSEVVYANPAYEKLSGFALKELKGTKPRVLQFLEKDPVLNKRFWDTVKKQKTFSSELLGYTKSGNAVPEEVVISPLRDVDSKELLWVNMIRDISERKKAEQEMLAEKKKYQDMMNNAPVAIYRNTVGPNGHFLEVNETGMKMFELESRADLERYNVTDIYQDPAMRKKVSDLLIRQGFMKDVEIPLRSLKGKEIMCSVSAVMRKDENGEVYFDGVAEDITERKRAESRIKELDDLRNRFIQIVSHQLRTPLNAIRWNLESLLNEEMGKLKKEQKEFIRLTYRAEMEVMSRINDLLTAMDIEEHRVAIMREETSIESVWSSVAVEWKRLCSVKRLMCEYVPPSESLPLVAVDPEKIRNVLRQLTTNAVEYTPEGGSVSAKMNLIDGKIRFEVTDSGIGIPRSEQKRIFTRFYRATNAQSMRPDASGLGLSIAKYFVDQHNGSIGFTSTEGKGSTFWFELPTGNSSIS